MAVIRGEKPDRPPVSLWRHFYNKESSVEGLVEATLAFQKKYDWDFMKINPRASYHVEDWGNRLEWSRDEFRKHIKIKFAVEKIDDWDKIEPLPLAAPILSEHLRAIKAIKKGSDPELPLFMTVFNPISIAADLVANGKILIKSLQADPKRVLTALENITVTFERYAEEILDAGADGLFFATTEWASNDTWDYNQYREYARPYDLRVLKAAGDGINLLHVCGSNNFLRQLADYPVQLINWEANDPTNINLDSALDLLPEKTMVGGIDHTGWLMRAAPKEIKYKMGQLRERYDGKKVIFGPGCAIDPSVPPENVAAVKDSLGRR
jgi:uroporphyrinogen decarboxylase